MFFFLTCFNTTQYDTILHIHNTTQYGTGVAQALRWPMSPPCNDLLPTLYRPCTDFVPTLYPFATGQVFVKSGPVANGWWVLDFKVKSGCKFSSSYIFSPAYKLFPGPRNVMFFIRVSGWAFRGGFATTIRHNTTQYDTILHNTTQYGTRGGPKPSGGPCRRLATV